MNTHDFDKLRSKLTLADSRIWRLKEIVAEFLVLHHQDPGDDAIDRILRLDRLCLEAQTVIDSIPDVLTIPPISGAANPDGEVGFVAPDPLDAA